MRSTGVPMGVAENKQVVLDFYEAGARGDMDACFALLAENVTWTNIGNTKFSGTYIGKQAIAEDLLDPLFSQLKAGISSQIEQLTAEGDIVVTAMGGMDRQYDDGYAENSLASAGQVPKLETKLTWKVLWHWAAHIRKA